MIASEARRVNTNHEQAVDAALAAAGSKATFGGAGGAVVGWIFSSEFGVIAGVAIGLAGLLVNWYYKYRQNKREQQEHDARMARENRQ